MQRTKMKSTEEKCRIHRDNMKNKKNNGITLIALVITIVLNCSYLAMDQMNKIEKI